MIARSIDKAVGATAFVLMKLRRRGEADRVLKQGLSRSPDNLALLINDALLTTQGGDHVEAFAKWEAIRHKHPDCPSAWKESAASARILSRVEEATAIITEALDRFPSDLKVLEEAAHIADRRRDFADALVLWERLASRSKNNPDYVQGYAYNLVMIGRFAEADATLDRAMRRFPLKRGFLATRGLLAMAREDWDGALAIWERYRKKYPDDQAGWENHGRTLTSKYLAAVDSEDPTTRLVAPVEIARVEDDAKRTLLLGFESVGSDCEFGMVQRRYGAEPLGLLRWNYVAYESLMAALAAGFAGMGDPEHTELWKGGVDEYFVQDKRWGLAMHTFLSSTQVDEAVFLPKMQRRVAYLKDKLLDDVKSGEKTIVFKTNDVSLDQIKALHQSFCQLGPVRLLWVRSKDVAGPDEAAAGDVREIGDGLYAGVVDRMGAAKGYWDIAFDDWVSICRRMSDGQASA